MHPGINTMIRFYWTPTHCIFTTSQSMNRLHPDGHQVSSLSDYVTCWSRTVASAVDPFWVPNSCTEMIKNLQGLPGNLCSHVAPPRMEPRWLLRAWSCHGPEWVRHVPCSSFQDTFLSHQRISQGAIGPLVASHSSSLFPLQKRLTLTWESNAGLVFPIWNICLNDLRVLYTLVL